MAIGTRKYGSGMRVARWSVKYCISDTKALHVHIAIVELRKIHVRIGSNVC